MVGQACERVRLQVTDYGFYVQRVLTRIAGKMGKFIVAFNQRRVKSPSWKGGHDVERGAVIVKGLCCNEIYQRNVSNKLRVETSVQNAVAKDPLSMVKLAMEIEKSTVDVGDYGEVFHPITSSRDLWWRAMFTFFSLGQPIAACKLRVCLPASHLQGVEETTFESTSEFVIHEGWSEMR